MYSTLKSILKTILPDYYLRQYQDLFRRLIYRFYEGNQFKCNICNATLKSFIELEKGDLLCPKCGSLPRTRRLYQLLNSYQLLYGKLLHFSPPLCLYKIFTNAKDFTYISSDFENEFIANQHYDLTNITVANNSFDTIIAYHILEHIEADQKAMKELYRILKKGGKGLIQTPFKEGTIYENKMIQSPEERLLHFGQKDHVRIYSVAALENRLMSIGFEVKRLVFNELASNFYGFKTEETVLLISK